MSTAETHRLIESRCPHCNYKLDAATNAYGGKGQPDPGDCSVCLNCGQVLIYQNDLTLRRISREEIAELMKDEGAWSTIEKAQLFIRRRGRFA